MKIYALIIFFLTFGLNVCSQSDIPNLPEEATVVSNIIPKGWDVLSTTKGDLNKDGIEDFVLVIENTLEENYKHHDGLGRDTINFNPRVLGIYFGKSKGIFKKKLQANNFILLQDNPVMDEPFDGIFIQDNGVLRIDFHFWSSAGSWYMSNHEYKFRYQNNVFELIGYEASERHRATGETTDYSINFSIRKMQTIHTIPNDETDEETTTENWRSFKLETLKSLKSLGTPFEWDFLDIRI